MKNERAGPHYPLFVTTVVAIGTRRAAVVLPRAGGRHKRQNEIRQKKVVSYESSKILGTYL